MMLFFLSGCAQAKYNDLALPDVVEYTKEQQKKAAIELENNDVPMVKEMVKDYVVMRDQTRAAQK